MRKEKYFTQETIHRKSQDFLDFVEKARLRHADIIFKPEKAALLVLDMQEYFLQETSHAFVPSAPAIVPGISRLVDAFAKAKRFIVATQHINTPENAGMMSKWWRDLINPYSAYSHFTALPTFKEIYSIIKTQYDAFYQTALENDLRNLEIEQVVICGVMTHLCCESTARSAFMRGFEVFFTIDGTATYNEDLHRASLLTLSHGFAVPVLIDELLKAMETDNA